MNTDSLKEQVRMKDVISRYASLGKHDGRCPCPIHGGANDNLSYKDHVFFCHTCGAKGDVIGFVEQLFDLGFKDAVNKIASDFGAKIDGGYCSDYRAAYAKAKRELYREECGKLIDLRCELTDMAQTPNVSRQIEYIDRLLDRTKGSESFGFSVEAMINSIRRMING